METGEIGGAKAQRHKGAEEQGRHQNRNRTLAKNAKDAKEKAERAFALDILLPFFAVFASFARGKA